MRANEKKTWLHDNRTIIIGMGANKQTNEGKWVKYYIQGPGTTHNEVYAIVTDFERLCGKS